MEERDQAIYLRELDNFIKFLDLYGTDNIVADLTLFYPETMCNFRKQLDFICSISN